MPLSFGTDAWASALVAEINGSSEYKNAASKWGDGFNGNILLVFDADATFSQTVGLLLMLERGACRGATFIDGASHPEAGFGLRAPFGVWRDVLEGRSLAATAILTGRMKVEGEKMTLLKHTAAHRALITCAASIDSEFPGAR